MDKLAQKFIDQATTFAPKLSVSLFIFLIFYVVALILPVIVRRVGRRKNLDQAVFNLIAQLVKAALIIFGAITALGTAGIDISALVAGLGLTGFALGFAFKDVLSNVLSGVLILIYRPFQKNDRISVAGFEGTVIQIDLRYTTLQAEDKKVLIPNSTLFTKPISVLNTQK